MTAFFDLRERLTSWFLRRDRDITLPSGRKISITGADIEITTGGIVITGGNITVDGTVDGVDISAHAANADAHHNRSHALDSASDHTGTLPWSDLNKTGSDLADLATRAHGDLTGVTSDQHHAETHTVASHSDTSATGSELNTLTDGSDASSLHDHDGRYYQESEFSANPGANTNPLKSDNSGHVRVLGLGVGVAPTTNDLNIHSDLDVGGAATVGSTIDVTNSVKISSAGVLELSERGAPATPASGKFRVYAKTDGKLYYKNDGGTEYEIQTV